MYEISCSCTLNMSSKLIIHGASASRCKNSARCRTVLDFSALNDGVRLQTGPKQNIIASRYSCALCERYADSSKYLTLKSEEPPSTADLTIMGAVTSIQSFSSNHWRANLIIDARIFAIAIIRLVLKARCLLSNNNSAL